MAEEHEATLYALGAVPVSELDEAQAVETASVKGQPVDVNGWLSPYWASSGSFLTDAQKERYGIPKEPLTYAEYISLLDVDGYRTSRHPLQFAVMAFVLENMLVEGTAIEDPDDIIRVYEAGVGLENRALLLLDDQVSSDEAMWLYRSHGDARLLDVFPVPRPDEESYIEFLSAVAEREPDRGWFALSLLYKMDAARYETTLRDSLIRRVHATSSEGERMAMYRTLVKLGDEESIEALAAALLSDPVTEVREAIIRATLAANACPRELVSSVIRLAEGQGEEHEPITAGRMAAQWQHSLREYLLWVAESGLCDAETRAEAQDALGRPGR